MRRVVAIWLDGFDMDLADEWELPTLARLRREGAWAELDAAGTQHTGLAGEHLATGLSPADSGRASMVALDPATYACVPAGATDPPALGGVPTVVLDPCYFDLTAAHPDVQGLTDWGSHDPGGPPLDRPLGLRQEVIDRFGSYPARRWVYATPWPSESDCAEMGPSLAAAVARRSEIARWLLTERFTDWRLALVGVSEAHTAIEGLYHGIDPAPWWRECSSREAASRGLREVYVAIDRLVADVVGQFPDDLHVVFSMHGMGENTGDVPSMLLLGELLRRWAGDPTPDLAFPVDAAGLPLPPGRLPWGAAVHAALEPPSLRRRARRAAARVVPEPVLRLRQRLRTAPARSNNFSPTFDWIPLMRHQPFWSTMRAFAVPSFYDGRVRVNLRGREASGLVSLDDYHAVLDEVEVLLRACVDPVRGHSVVESVERPLADPLAALPTDADMVVLWNPGVFGFRHPSLGTIGPVPPRRTGGHAKPIGRCLMHGAGVERGALGRHSTFDVVPTLLALSGSEGRTHLSGSVLPLAWAD